MRNKLEYWRGSIIKYVCRAGSKFQEGKTMKQSEIDDLNNVESYDVMYYGEKYKQKLYDFSDEVLRPYFKSENVINGAFKVANKLYGLNFEILDEFL